MFRLTQSEWETFKRRHEPEVFTKAMMEGWIEDIKEDLMKAESGEQLDEPTTNLVNNFKEELQSFQKVTVIRNAEENSLSKGLIYEEYYIRPQQVEWIENDITKSETGEIEKSRYGKYKNTELNRKLGRVGVEFGKKGEKKEESKKDSRYSKLDENRAKGIAPKFEDYKFINQNENDGRNARNVFNSDVEQFVISEMKKEGITNPISDVNNRKEFESRMSKYTKEGMSQSSEKKEEVDYSSLTVDQLNKVKEDLVNSMKQFAGNKVDEKALKSLGDQINKVNKVLESKSSDNKEQGSSFNDHYERSLSEGNSHERATEIANQAVKEDNPEKFEHAEKRAFGEVRSHKELKVDRGDWSAKKPDHLLIRKDTGKIIAGYASMNVPNYSKYTGPNNNTPFKIISGFNSMNPAPYLNQKPVDVMNENDWEK